MAVKVLLFIGFDICVDTERRAIALFYRLDQMSDRALQKRGEEKAIALSISEFWRFIRDAIAIPSPSFASSVNIWLSHKDKER